MWFRKKNKPVNMDVEILVLGNRGAGKTSLLATTLNEMDKLDSSGIDFKPADEKTKALLKKSIDGIESMFNSKGRIEVGEGIEGTDGFQDFRFQLKFTDRSWNEASKFNLIFHDYAGGILAGGDKDKQYARLKEYFLRSQIVYILIDTPYLMEAKRKTIGEYSAKDEILALFDDEETTAKSADRMVVIVPTKCEYYLQRDRFSDIEDRIQREFKELFQLNKAGDKETYKLYITPVQTVGGLEFCRMEDKNGRQAATYRRTKPGSQFKPENTDLLLVFCLDYLLGNFFEQMVTQIKSSKRSKIIKSLEKSDDKRELAPRIDEYKDIADKNRKNRTKNTKRQAEKQQTDIFKQMMRVFFSEYGERESIIDKICGQYAEINDCYILYMEQKELRDMYGKRFKQHFTEY